MAKTKAPQQRRGVHGPAKVTTRTTKRPSGHQHRKKAEVRQTTAPGVFEFLEFVTRGVWPLKGTPRLRSDGPVGRGPGEYSPTVAGLRQLALDYLRGIGPERGKGQPTEVLVAEDAFRNFVDAAVEESTPRGASDTTLQEIRHLQGVCLQALVHLDEDERWRNVYQCATCSRWFFARNHDPRNPLRPYCSRRCWPSTHIRDDVSPPRRVQSRKN